MIYLVALIWLLAVIYLPLFRKVMAALAVIALILACASVLHYG